MLKIIVVSHGKFAEGLVDAASVIVGNSENVFALGLEAGEVIEDFGEKIFSMLNSFEETDEIIVFTDIEAASPYNQTILSIQKLNSSRASKVFVIGGVNLPMLLEGINHQYLKTPIINSVEEICKVKSMKSDYWNIEMVTEIYDDDF